MRRIGYRLLTASLALMLLAGAGELPDTLRRGVNVTHWFRFPPRRDPSALRFYLDDATLDALKHAGFTFVRVPVQIDMLAQPDALASAVARVRRHGLAAIVALFAANWHLESDPADQAKLLETWRSLALLLRRFDPATTFPEVLNEPVFASEPGAWATLQHRAVLTIRAILPANTIVLTGADWGGVDGLLSLPPEPDANVIYSFHLYEPVELTALGAYRTGLDTDAMARLPFPVTDEGACKAIAGSTGDPPTADLMRFYCAQHWDVAKLTARIAAAAAWGQRYRVPVLAGESGASQHLNAPARLAWLTGVRTAFEQNTIGWALWGYDDSMGLARHPPNDHRRLDPDVLHALGLAR